MPSVPGLHETPLIIPARLLRGTLWSRVAVLLLGAVVAGVVVTLVMRTSGPPEPRFRTAPALRRTIVQSVEATGELDVPRRTELAVAGTGRLAEVLVGPGARVERGQILARLDPRTARLEVESVRAAERAARGKLDEARAAHRAAVQARARAEELFGLALAKPHQVDSAKLGEERAHGALAAAEGERAQAARRRELAELAQRELTIRAPERGVVLSAPSRIGAVVSSGGPALFVLGNTLESLVLRALVAEAEIGRVRPEQAAEFSVPAHPGRVFSARVTAIQIEPERRQGIVSYPVLLTAENPSGLLLPGMTATVRVEIGRMVDALAVREAALRFTPEDVDAAPPRSRIWLSHDGVGLEAVAVSAGMSDGTYTAIVAREGSLDSGAPAVVGLLSTGLQAKRPGVSLGSRP